MKLDAYLRALRLSVGNKLSLCLHLQLLVYPVTFFCLGLPEMHIFSDVYAES